MSESPGEREEERGGARRGEEGRQGGEGRREEGRRGERRSDEERGAEEIREASLKSLNIFSHLVDTSLLLHNVAFVI